jgi:hypothetical protein
MFAAAVAVLPVATVAAQGFKFSQPDEAAKQDAAAEAARQAMIADHDTLPAPAGKKIMVIGQLESNGFTAAQQQNYGPHYGNQRCAAGARPESHTGGNPRRSSRRRSMRI